MDDERFDGMTRAPREMHTRRGALATLAGIGFSALSPAASARKRKTQAKRSTGQITVHELGHALGLGRAVPLETTDDIMGYALAPWFHLPPREPVISTGDPRALDEIFAWRVNGTTPRRPAAVGIECATLAPYVPLPTA